MPLSSNALSTTRRVRVAGGLAIATAVVTPLVPAGPAPSAEAATKAQPVATVVKQAKNRSWAERQKTAQKALKAAHKKKGKPYRYGAAGPNAFDCSGLVQWSYRKAGVKLPRVTTAQYRAVKNKVSWSKLAPGDLVFFHGKGHVGIVSKRKGSKVWMIHAPNSGSHVKVVRLNSYRKKTFSGAVRPY
ncbi:C40 family peptidase [Actinomadura rudentiformis]|uniref:NlpC/P60 family protein n=1 Tax=Actinomadura rudentiformis TaxID=359158 RepID=A0A6H9YNB7_9ACTN|nr:C40 family peptidase [Actinomadura rudentiformis]KAB2342925.1 NlpC/P60 family protein [Actinomadura rudentiformis]